jgi:hypothetical protein
MSINLYKISNISWVVRVEDSDYEAFTNVDDAANFLEALGISEDEVDAALIDLATNNHSRANFGVNKSFIVSDNERFDELFGLA